MNQDKPLKGEWDFNLRKKWETENAGDNVLVRGSSIQVDDEGNVFFFELKHAKIVVFDRNGNFISSFGKKGEGPGEYKMAQRILLEGKKIIVPDMGRFHYFSKNGDFLKTIDAGSMIFPLAFLDENRFIFTTEQDSENKKTDSLRLFNLLTKNGEDITDIEAETPLTASSGGMAIRLKDSLTAPGLVLGVRGENLFFGKNDKYLIKKTDLKGTEIYSFSLEGRKRKKISMEYKRKRFDNVLVNGRKMPKNMIDQMVKRIPDEAPFFNRILVRDSGLIYVFITDLENETGREIDIFSPEGNYLYHAEIKMPENLIIKSGLTFKNDHLYLFAEDEEGVGKLIKFKIDQPMV
jgi:hypothetical protein